MDNKQQHIFKQILDKNKLSHDNVFIQHRNLKEFKSFFLVRINPNHRIELYGRLKRSKVKDHNFNKSIKVGEILLCMGVYTLSSGWLLSISLNILMGIILFDILLGLIIDVDSDRGEYRKWQNSVPCTVS